MEKSKPKFKLLAVDDNKSIQMIVKQHLSSKLSITSAANPDEAMNWMKQQNFPDIIVLDMHMDGDSEAGYKFLTELRASGFFGTIPVIILSGSVESADSETRIRFLKAGADDFLQKPFDPIELEWRIIAVLRTKGALSYSEIL